MGRVLLLKDKVDFLGNLVLKPHPSLQSIREKKNGLRGYRRERGIEEIICFLPMMMMLIQSKILFIKKYRHIQLYR